MGKAVKFAVSMPEEVFEEMEEVRQKEGLSRSKLVFEAIRLWKESKRTEESSGHMRRATRMFLKVLRK